MSQAPYRGLRMIFVGNLNGYSRSMARLRAFQALGLEVTAIQHSSPGDPRTGIERASLPIRALSRVGVVLDTQSAGKALLRTAERFEPQIVWIEKGSMLQPGVLIRLKTLQPDATLVWFSEDDMFAPHNRSKRFDAGLARYDLMFTTKAYNTDPAELPALGARRVVFVNQAFDPAQHHPIKLTTEDRRRYGADIGFIGSFEAERAQSMLKLAQAGLQVRIWGNLWERFGQTHPNLRIEQRALVNNPPDDLDYSRGIAATKINLCFLRKMNRDQHTSRTFEIPAIGGFMLAERTDEHLRLFKENEEAIFFGSNDELVEKARYYLEHEGERRAIAARGHDRCIRDYGSVAQAQLMLDEVMAARP